MKNFFTLAFLIFLFSGFSQSKEKKIYSQINNSYDNVDAGKMSTVVLSANQTLQQSIRIQNDTLIGHSYNLLGIVSTQLNDSKKAIFYFNKAIFHFTKAKRVDKVLVIMNNLGLTYENNLQYDKSLEYFDKVLELARKNNSPETIIYPLYNCGFLNCRLGNFKVAEKLLFEAINPTIQKKDYNHLAYIYSSIGLNYFSSNQIKQSEIYYDKAIKLAKTNNYNNVLVEIYSDRAESFGKIKDYKKANEYLVTLKNFENKINQKREIELKAEIERDIIIKEKQEHLRLSQIFITLLSFSIILLLISLFFIYQKNKKTKRDKNEIKLLSDSKSAFYAEISHELRTPLYAVIELSNLLLKEKPENTENEYLSSLKFSADYLLTLINNVLELNKLDSLHVKAQNNFFNLKELIRHIIGSVEYALDQKSCKLVFDYDDTIPKQIYGDKIRISQIMINLLTNAIKFTNEGLITITIKKISESENDINLFFEVKDSGEGIPVNKQKQIFQDYFQDNNATKNTKYGTGLGLSIVNKLIHLLGSKIHIESKVGQGSAFSFNLIFNNKIKEKLEIEETSFSISDMANYNFIVIDDNKINLLITKKILEQFNATCQTTDNGLSGIELIKNNDFDCVYLDLNMIGLDGYETAQEIRKFNSKITIIALTAALNENITENLKTSGFDNIISKPFITERFVEVTLKEILKKTS